MSERVITGADFRAIRHLVNMSVNEAADYCGVSRRTISRWEHNHVPIPNGAYRDMLELIHTATDEQVQALQTLAELVGVARRP